MKGDSIDIATPSDWKFEGSASDRFLFVPDDPPGAPPSPN